MWLDNIKEQVVNLKSEIEKSKLKIFLEQQNLSIDDDIEYSVILTDGGKIIASGSFSDRILKCIAVGDEYRSYGLSAKIITNLVNEQYRRGKNHLFIYTKPKNKLIFSELGFYTIAEAVPDVVLMENRSDGIQKYLNEIYSESGEIVSSASVVVNCNPFTLGHKYLLEYAAARCKKLHVFVVWEDKSSFPNEIRYKLIEQGIRHLSNVILHKGKDYIISRATFPSYFIKNDDDLVKSQAKLDLKIFGSYIAPKLNIKKRFVGDEPYCKVTSYYNKIMNDTLPNYGINIEILPRLSLKGKAISASRVRELIRNNKIQETKDLLPETTYQFLLSSKAKQIICHIQSEEKRH